MSVKRPISIAILGLGLAVGLLWTLGGSAPPALANPGTRYVATDGSDTGNCTNPGSPCATIQYAVDRSSSDDTIKVAKGTYTGVSARGGVTQVVYISKTVTIRGGYTTTNWLIPNALANPTTVDAQGDGRTFYITGSINPALRGLRITGGNATGLGGGPNGKDAGGGVYVVNAGATISNCLIYSNTASTDEQGYGGGIYLQGLIGADISGNLIYSNTSSKSSTGDGYGGGVALYYSNATLSGFQQRCQHGR